VFDYMRRARRGNGADAESAAVLVALRRIVRYLRLADRAAEAACEISAAQLFVLRALSETPGMSLAELARTTVTDQSSVSTVVARLVARRLVQRRHSTRDRRRAELHVSATGARVLRSAPSVPQREMIAAIRAMSAARRRELVRALEGLVALIGATEVAPRMLFEDER
jgi:DNA-binding MarR family transcriptional regulator